MDLKIEKCIDCNRLIVSDATRSLCDICYDQFDRDLGLIENAISINGRSTASEIAEDTHLSVKRINQILKQQKVLAHEVESESVCTQCKRKLALSHSRYCLACQLAMYKSLGDELTLASKHYIKPFEKPDSSISSVREQMDNKRDRAGFNRYTPNPSVKGSRRR